MAHARTNEYTCVRTCRPRLSGAPLLLKNCTFCLLKHSIHTSDKIRVVRATCVMHSSVGSRIFDHRARSNDDDDDDDDEDETVAAAAAVAVTNALPPSPPPPTVPPPRRPPADAEPNAVACCDPAVIENDDNDDADDDTLSMLRKTLSAMTSPAYVGAYRCVCRRWHARYWGCATCHACRSHSDGWITQVVHGATE